MTDGARTHNRWIHNPELCLLSYGHRVRDSSARPGVVRMAQRMLAISFPRVLTSIQGGGNIDDEINSSLSWQM